MGTQEIIRDHFLAARDYRREWQAWETTQRGLPPRRSETEAAGRLDDDLHAGGEEAHALDEFAVAGGQPQYVGSGLGETRRRRQGIHA